MSYLDTKLTNMLNSINSYTDVFYAVKNIKTENIEQHITTTYNIHKKRHNRQLTIKDIREFDCIEKITKNAFTLGDIYKGLETTLRYRFIHNKHTTIIQAEELSKYYYLRGNVLSTIRYIITENMNNKEVQMFIRETVRKPEYESILHKRRESTEHRIRTELSHAKGVIEIMKSELTEDTKKYCESVINKVEQYLQKEA